MGTTTEVTVTTESPEETESLGGALYAILPSGTFVALQGDLAAGKTCLVRGMMRTAAPGVEVSSPTFTLVNEYAGDRTIYHLDLYRLSGPEELIDLGHEELFDSSDGVCLVEWAERAGDLLPEKRVDVVIEHAGADKRSIRIADRGALASGWIEALRRGRP